MAQDNQKPPAPATEATTQDGQASKKAKKFSFSLNFFRKNNNEKEFAGKVAPSKRELEAQATKRRAQRAKMQGGLKPQPAPVEAEAEESEEHLQPA
jgi:hypothetical protein